MSIKVTPEVFSQNYKTGNILSSNKKNPAISAPAMHTPADTFIFKNKNTGNPGFKGWGELFKTAPKLTPKQKADKFMADLLSKIKNDDPLDLQRIVRDLGRIKDYLTKDQTRQLKKLKEKTPSLRFIVEEGLENTF